MTAREPETHGATPELQSVIEPANAEAWFARARTLRARQRMVDAVAAFDRAAALAPDDGRIVAARAQTRFACGLDAADAFRRACELLPDDLEVGRQWAVSLAAEGDRARGEALLEAALAAHPGWLEGHRTLATLRWTSGERDRYLDGYRRACRAEPRNVSLRLAWFQTLALTRDWGAAQRVLEEAEESIGEQPFVLSRLYLACESHATTVAERLLEATRSVRDPGVDLCRVRHYLRTGQLDAADAAAERICQTPAARLGWPYRSLIWRLRGDSRADWLDGAPPFVATFDLNFNADELAELAGLLRALHTASAPYLEQSVRGGTQTDRPLFFRHESIIQSTRAKMVDAVRRYADALPARDAAHPLLGPARDREVTFSGSWSVLLRAHGFNVSHTHPMGWISSALYVDLPSATQLGDPPGGWLQFGVPPPELGLELGPLHRIEPRPGRLVLFPSTLWHGTIPFPAGERLVVAFDVSPPHA